MLRRVMVILAALPFLAACAELRVGGMMPSDAEPEARPAAGAPRTPQSFEIERFFAGVEARLVARGLLRADGGGPDTPFTADMLARNFSALAFSEEFSSAGGLLVRQSSEIALHRWDRPVRLEPVFGPTVTENVARDRAEIERLALRLTRAARHPVSTVDRDGNFLVLIMNDQELDDAPTILREFLPAVTPAQTAYVADLPRETYCVVLATDRGRGAAFSAAVAVIRAELPDRLRTACIHEEIAQGLGLSNDSPTARPSIFNDDDEFGRLTTHDEMLLRILYDPRLRIGMTRAQAAPIIRQIARELVGGDT